MKKLLIDFNNIHPKLFTFEKEQSNHINFLDIKISRTDSDFEYDTYRKPTSDW
jgi:hypothetical protein